MFPYAGLKVIGKLFQSFGRIAHDHFGSCKSLTGHKGVGELLLHKPQLHPGLAELVHSGAAAEASAPDELHRVAAARGLGRLLVRKDHHGVELMGRSPSPASDHLLHVRDRCSLEIALHGMAAVEGDQVVISIDLVKTRAHDFFQSDLLAGGIRDQRASRDDIELGKNTVQKFYFKHSRRVAKNDLQRLRLIFRRVYGRKSLQRVLAVCHPKALKAQVAGRDAVSILRDQRGAPHISGPRYRELLREKIQ